jgi:magnesium-transporting ATPase (P-type)
LPNADLYEFKGMLKTREDSFPLSETQLLLKGARLQNTSWILGVVVYTGLQTKLMQN